MSEKKKPFMTLEAKEAQEDKQKDVSIPYTVKQPQQEAVKPSTIPMRVVIEDVHPFKPISFERKESQEDKQKVFSIPFTVREPQEELKKFKSFPFRVVENPQEEARAQKAEMALTDLRRWLIANDTAERRKWPELKRIIPVIRRLVKKLDDAATEEKDGAE